LPNFVDCAVFRPAVNAAEKRSLRAALGIPPDAFVVGCVAAVKKHHKRIDYLIREFYQLTMDGRQLAVDWRSLTEGSAIRPKDTPSTVHRPPSTPYLLVAGSRTDETPELLALAESLIPGRYRIMTNCARAQMPDLLRAMDVFVLTSLFEMMPIALLEALATGLPCLVNCHPVLEWMIGTEYEKSIEQKTAKSTKGENVAPPRHGDTENKDITPPLACPEPVEGLFAPLQEGLRGFKAEYSPPSIPATLDSSVLSSPCLSASVVNVPTSCALRASVQNSSPSGGMEINMSKEGALAQALADLTLEWLESHGRQARERALRMFSKETVISQYVEYYREVMGEG